MEALQIQMWTWQVNLKRELRGCSRRTPFPFHIPEKPDYSILYNYARRPSAKKANFYTDRWRCPLKKVRICFAFGMRNVFTLWVYICVRSSTARWGLEREIYCGNTYVRISYTCVPFLWKMMKYICRGFRDARRL